MVELIGIEPTTCRSDRSPLSENFFFFQFNSAFDSLEVQFPASCQGPCLEFLLIDKTPWPLSLSGFAFSNIMLGKPFLKVGSMSNIRPAA